MELAFSFNAVDFSYSPSIVDMTAGLGELSSMLNDLSYGVVSNSVVVGADTDYHFDAMQPASYESMRHEVGSHVIIVTPQIDFVDVIMPMAVMYAQHFVCCRVPCRYLNERREYSARDAWLKKLEEERRLLVISPAAALDGAMLVAGSVWMLVFASEELLRLMA